MNSSALNRIVRNRRGAAMVEYVLIVTVIAIALIVSYKLYSNSVQTKLYQGGDRFKKAESLSSRSSAEDPNNPVSGADRMTGGASTSSSVKRGEEGVYSTEKDLPSDDISNRPLVVPGKPGVGSYNPSDVAERVVSGIQPGESRGPSAFSNTVGNEQLYERTLADERWRMALRTLLMILSAGILGVLIVTTYIRMRSMIKQARIQGRD